MLHFVNHINDRLPHLIFGGWIEGRRSPIGANGTIRVSGGPPDPLGKVYTLDVQMKKAFTTVSGTDIYLKQIVVATCTPA